MCWHVLYAIGCVLICYRVYSAMVSLPHRNGLAILYGGDDRFDNGILGQIISVC